MRTIKVDAAEGVPGGLRVTPDGFLEVRHGHERIGVEPTPESARELSQILLVLADFKEEKISAAEFLAYLQSRAGKSHA